MQQYLPRIRTLYLKHIGVSKALSETFEEATAVCLSDGPGAPTPFEVAVKDTTTRRLLRWQEPNVTQHRAWANTIDCIEAAAYGVALSAVESEFGFVAIERASTRTGADYYLASSLGDYLENAVRLEVSGTASAEAHRIRDRMKDKMRQVAHPSDPSLACVVSFGALVIMIESA
ncbi:MAG: hypothetical protein ACXW5U_08705 [Thermoanaerobaculia bacterium]